MWTQSTRPAAALQAATSPDCRHSREPFDCSFHLVTSRRDLSDGAKLLHAKLVSMHRLGAAWTQTTIGAAFGWSRQKVWRCTGELVAAGLVVVTRHGQGRPNSYVLLTIDAAALDGTQPRSRAGHQDGRPPAPPGRVSFNRLKEGPKNRTTGSGYGDFSHGSRAAWVSRYGPLTMG
jgi:biotin operon repressor